MVKGNIIELECQPFEEIIHVFQSNPEIALKNIKYLNERINRVKNGDINFYYFISSFKTMMNIDLQFTEDFLHNEYDSVYYPTRVKCFVIIKDIIRVYTLSDLEKEQLGKYGVYFIYDNEGVLRYIGKSTSCVIGRSFKSAKERALLDFLKIEYRFPKTKSDVALYEAYYIAKFKPEKNSDLIFEDELTIELPEIKVEYSIKRNSDSYIEKEYVYFIEKVLDIDDYLEEDNVLISNQNNKKSLIENGIHTKQESYNKAYCECVTIAREKELIILNECF